MTLISNVAIYLTYRAQYVQEELFFHRVVQIGENALGDEHPLVAEALHGLAALYREQGKYEQMEQLHASLLNLRGEGDIGRKVRFIDHNIGFSSSLKKTD